MFPPISYNTIGVYTMVEYNALADTLRRSMAIHTQLHNDTAKGTVCSEIIYRELFNKEQ